MVVPVPPLGPDEPTDSFYLVLLDSPPELIEKRWITRYLIVNAHEDDARERVIDIPRANFLGPTECHGNAARL